MKWILIVYICASAPTWTPQIHAISFNNKEACVEAQRLIWETHQDNDGIIKLRCIPDTDKKEMPFASQNDKDIARDIIEHGYGSQTLEQRIPYFQNRR